MARGARRDSRPAGLAQTIPARRPAADRTARSTCPGRWTARMTGGQPAPSGLSALGILTLVVANVSRSGMWWLLLGPFSLALVVDALARTRVSGSADQEPSGDGTFDPVIEYPVAMKTAAWPDGVRFLAGTWSKRRRRANLLRADLTCSAPDCRPPVDATRRLRRSRGSRPRRGRKSC